MDKSYSLKDYQKLIKQLVKERGFDKESVAEVFMLLVEEVGELGKAIRKSSTLKVDKKSAVHDINEEAADVLWLLLDLANRLGIDLEKAFHKKEAKNIKRQWS